MTTTEHRFECATCTDGQHPTSEEALTCAARSAEAAQTRADELPLGIYEKNGQRFRVEKSDRNGHNYARLQDPHTRRYEYAPGAIKTLNADHLVRQCRDNREVRRVSWELAREGAAA